MRRQVRARRTYTALDRFFHGRVFMSRLTVALYTHITEEGLLPLRKGVYVLEGGPTVILAGKQVHEKVFELFVLPKGVWEKELGVTFVTDSVDALKALTSRGFPLQDLADELSGLLETKPADQEFIFLVVTIDQEGQMKEESSKFRFIRRSGPLEFEVRVIK